MGSVHDNSRSQTPAVHTTHLFSIVSHCYSEQPAAVYKPHAGAAPATSRCITCMAAASHTPGKVHPPA